jgi:hypothetical protein
VRPSVVQIRDARRIDVDPSDVMADGREGDGERQSRESKTDDGDACAPTPQPVGKVRAFGCR